MISMDYTQRNKLILIIVILALLIGSIVGIQLMSQDNRPLDVFKDYVAAFNDKDVEEVFALTGFKYMNESDELRVYAHQLISDQMDYLTEHSAVVTTTSTVLLIRGHMNLTEVMDGVFNYSILKPRIGINNTISLQYQRIEAAMHAQGTGIDWNYYLEFFAYLIDDQWCLYLNHIVEDSPPVTTIGLSGVKSTNDWWHTNVTIWLNATDSGIGTSGVGVDHVYYRINETAWLNYTGSFLLTSAGANKVEYYAVDKLGNEEYPQRITIKIDNSTPVTTIGFSGETSGAIYHSNVTIWLNATDSGSGVGQTYYRINGTGGWLLYTNAFQLTADGTYQIEFYSKDRLGLSETTQSETVTIDKP